MRDISDSWLCFLQRRSFRCRLCVQHNTTRINVAPTQSRPSGLFRFFASDIGDAICSRKRRFEAADHSTDTVTITVRTGKLNKRRYSQNKHKISCKNSGAMHYVHRALDHKNCVCVNNDIIIGKSSIFQTKMNIETRAYVCFCTTTAHSKARPPQNNCFWFREVNAVSIYSPDLKLRGASKNRLFLSSGARFAISFEMPLPLLSALQSFTLGVILNVNSGSVVYLLCGAVFAFATQCLHNHIMLVDSTYAPDV